MDQNYLTCTLQSVGKQFNYTPNYLSSLIKKSTGKKFSHLILEKRLQQAKFLLTNTNETVYTIASDCGFSNLTFFYKKFKDRYGCLPSEIL
ncbi:helix-turn-helix transcriptional regulator [Peribacillus sp. NPDC096379]|uniref:helix-turn-helix transcriptional regulator n=1 Tax=Peribacillus sp. NPDC096379 TaxID=3364393 RepID=UPI00382A36FB